MTIQARFSGVCPQCGERWQPGDLIRSEATQPGELPTWAHAVCPTPYDALTVNPGEKACAACWLIHPEGACDR